jgi:glycosyltransferase involved in cell wall biosynthesis
MNICILTYSFYESDTRILQYATALLERGDTVDVFALGREGAPAFEVLDGANVYRLQSRKINEQNRLSYLIRILRFVFVSACVLGRKHLANPYQIVHVHSVPDFLVFAAALPRVAGARVILDIHDILPEFYSSKFGIAAHSVVFKFLVLVERLSIRCSDHVIIANHLWHERLLSRSVGPDKCTTIINYPDPRIFYPRARAFNNGPFLITYPGTLNHHQGLDIAIRAFATVAGEIPNAQFHIYGEGPAKDSLRRMADELLLSRQVIFHDFLPTDEIAEIMAASKLAIVPKRASSAFGNEAASTKIMEFMALGIPVIVSRTKVDCFYHNDSRVKFFESENVPDLARCILLLWQDSTVRAELVANALEYVHRNNWEEKKREYLSLVDAMAMPSKVVEKCASQC